jgi:aryl-alcohol dehydrogenase-like predicted oxidoreductase
MEYKNRGRSGLKVSILGLDCINFHTMNDEAESATLVHEARHLSMNLFHVAAGHWRADAEGLSAMEEITGPPEEQFGPAHRQCGSLSLWQ